MQYTHLYMCYMHTYLSSGMNIARRMSALCNGMNIARRVSALSSGMNIARRVSASPVRSRPWRTFT